MARTNLNLPPVTRLLLLTLITFTLLNAILRPESTHLTPFFYAKGNGSPYLSIIPGSFWSSPWTLVTACFVEQNVWGLAVSGLTLFYGGRYLERAWGSREYAKFLAIVGIVPNIMCLGAYGALYAASSSGRALHATISGSIALQSAFLVSFKQLVPEHTVSILRGLIRMRVKHFPAVHLAANTISGLLLGTETAMWLSWSAFFTSWIYLRFFRKTSLLSSSASTSATGGESAETTLRGDASDTFAFAYFFPEPIHTPIAMVSEHVYQILVGLKILPSFSEDEIASGNEHAMSRAEGGLPSIMSTRGGNSNGSGRREEAERRRALALRALDQRLRQGTSPGPAAPAAPAPAQASDAGETPAPKETRPAA